MRYETLSGVEKTKEPKRVVFFQDPTFVFCMPSTEPFGMRELRRFYRDVENWLYNHERKLHNMGRAKLKQKNTRTCPDCWYTGFQQGCPGCKDQIRAFRQEVRPTWIIGRHHQGS